MQSPAPSTSAGELEALIANRPGRVRRTATVSTTSRSNTLDDDLIIHAMPLRPVFRTYLIGEDQ